MPIVIHKAAEAPGSVPAVVLGIDPSTYTGVAVLKSGQTLHTEVVNFPDSKGFVRLQLIANRIGALVEQFNPDGIFIEAPVSHGAWNMLLQAQIATVIRLKLHEMGRGWYDISPTTLKKWVTGKGGADKKSMAKHIAQKWNFESKSDDINDAYALAQLGVYVMETGPMKGVRCEHE